MEINEYQQEALKSVLWDKCYNQTYLRDGLSEEVGEIHGKFKRAIRDSDTPMVNGELVFNEEQIDAIALELGDVLWYLSTLSHKLGLTLEDVAQRNIFKLQKRMANGTIKGAGDNR